MSPSTCQSGTERIATVLSSIEGPLIVNVQGDEPLIDPAMLDHLIADWYANPTDVITPVFPIRTMEQLIDPGLVKVVRASDGRAIYFSRSPIPYLRDLPVEEWVKHQTFWGHVGVYGYRWETLEAYATLPASALETAERLEQLRFLDAGYRIQTFETVHDSMAVDTPADLDRVRLALSETTST